MSNGSKRGPVAQLTGLILLIVAGVAAYAIVSSDPAREEAGARARTGASARASRSGSGGGVAAPAGGTEPERAASGARATTEARGRPSDAEQHAEPRTGGSTHPGPDGDGRDRAPERGGEPVGDPSSTPLASLDAGTGTAERGGRRPIPVRTSGEVARRIAPTPPERTLARWESMQRAVEDRLTVLREDLARHRHSGDTARAARAEQLIRDLEAQRPVLAERIEALRREQAAGDPGP